MATFKSNSYEGRYLQLTITETANPTDNSSTLKWTLTSTGGTSSYYQVSETTVKINGVQVYHKGLTKWDDRVFPAAKGSVTGSLVVKHNADGTKNGVSVVFTTGVYTGVINDYGGSINLTKIDRTAPVVSFSVSNITTNSLTISATANTTCEEWYYSLDNGVTWKTYSVAVGTSASTTVTGLAVNTLYHIKVHARRAYNDVPGISSTVSVKTLGQAVINSCPEFYADTATVSFSPNVTVYEARFEEYVIVKNGSAVLFTLGPFDWTAGTANRVITLTDGQKQTLLKAMSKATLTLTLIADSYNGSTFVGSSPAVNVTAKTSNENSKPSWEAPYISWEDTSACAAVTGNPTIMVQGYSNLVVTALGVSTRNYATIVDYTVTIGDKTVKSSSPVVNVGKIETDGNLSMRLTVTDSRGHSHDLIRTVTVLKYAPPKVNKITLRRANGIDDVIQLSFTASMSTIKPDGETDVNALATAEYYYRPTNEVDYGNGIPFTDKVVRSSSGTMLSFETKQLLSLDNSCSYDFVLHIADRITSQWTAYVIPKGIPALAIRKDKIGINTPTPQYALDVVGDVNFTGMLLRNGNIFTGKYTTSERDHVLRYAGAECLRNVNTSGLMLLSDLSKPSSFVFAYYHFVDESAITTTPIASNGLTYDANKYGTVVIKDTSNNIISRPYYTIMPCFTVR